jgi:hypothetical protein
MEVIDEVHAKGFKGLEAEYWFLQRPKEEWYVHRRTWGKPEPIKLADP